MILKSVFLIAIVAVAMIGMMVPSVFANVVITSTIGSATPGCEVSSSCFIPSVATVNVGETIIFLNIDDVAHHTFTSGIPSDDVIGTEFNSGTVIEVSCTKLDEVFRRKMGWSEGLMVLITPKEIDDWLTTHK